MAGRDITEGRAARAVAVDVGVVSNSTTWQNSNEAYDVALGGMPFIYAIADDRPYIRQTAPFRKEQFDNQTEPGEQSLTGWWIRSQMSFHSGDGITFYDPATTDAPGHYRFADSRGVNVWTQGQVTLLNDTIQNHVITGPIRSNNRTAQHMRSIQWAGTSGVLLHDDYDVDKIDADGNVTHFIDYNSGIDDPVWAICDDGTTAYWLTNDTVSGKLEVNKKVLTASSATAATVMFTQPGITVTNGVMEFVKGRIVMAANNSIYEFPTSATTLPTALYTHPSTSQVYTSITASGAAIYVSGYNGIQSTIQRFTLASNGTMPTLTSAVVAAEFPAGEVVHSIYYYLGYMMIGTNKGVRAALVGDDGSINYGPLIVQTSQPCYQFAARDHFVWCATGVDGNPGLIRMDLSNQVEALRFAWANDIYYSDVTGHQTSSCAFIDGTERVAFTTCKVNDENGHYYSESATDKRTSGYLQTGYI